MSIPPDTHEWLSFEDDKEDRTWLIDVTFLESGWECIYGNGCQGVYTEPTPELVEGCCSYGAHFVDEKDIKHVERAAEKLTADQWQHRSIGKKKGITKTRGKETTTRLVDGACIFLNRPGFDGGPGCALHRMAIEAGQIAMKYKPEVCWQLPLRREDSVDEQGHVTSRVTEWRRRSWGSAGEDFHWWCTEDPAAFTSKIPVYKSMGNELQSLLGKSVYKRIAAILDARHENSKIASVALPHPAVRRIS